jgi:hypothetical protein
MIDGSFYYFSLTRSARASVWTFEEMTPSIGGNWLLDWLGQNGTRRTITGTSSGGDFEVREKKSFGCIESESGAASSVVSLRGFGCEFGDSVNCSGPFSKHSPKKITFKLSLQCFLQKNSSKHRNFKITFCISMNCFVKVLKPGNKFEFLLRIDFLRSMTL